MVFEGSDVPLTEDILKKKVEFVKSWLEWASENRRQILVDAASANGSTSLFVVPENETLFITSAWVANTASDETSLRVRGNNPVLILLRCFTGSNSISYPMPIKIESGTEIFSLTTGAANAGSAGFQGFVIPKLIT